MSNVLLIFIYYIAILTLLYLVGRALFIIIEIFTKREIHFLFDIKKEAFFLIIGLVIFSQILFIFNFFLGLNKFNIIIFITLLLIINVKNFTKIKSYKEFGLNIFICFLLFITFYDTGLSKDSYLYHLMSQEWIYTEKIVFGLSNLNPYLGYMSISEFPSALLNEINLNFAHIFNLVYLISFFSLMIGFIFSKIEYYKNIAFCFGVFGILDNFGFDGGRNGFIATQEINKFDYSFSILCILFIVFSVYSIIIKKDISNIDHFVFSLFFIYAVQLRIFGYILLPLYFYMMFSFNKLRSIYNFSFIFLILWSIKNFINTSCFIYPINLSCISTDWLFQEKSKYISYLVLDSFRDPENGINTINNLRWINEVFLPNNQNIIKNFLLTVVFFKLLKILFFKHQKIKRDYVNLIKVYLIVFILFGLWIFYLPQYRFSSFFLMTSFVILNLDFLKSEHKFVFGLNLIITIFSFLLLINMNDYKSFYNNPSEISQARLPNTQYVDLTNYGVKPVSEVSKGVLCFDRKDCYSANYELSLSNLRFNYKIIKPIDKNYYLDLIQNLK